MKQNSDPPHNNFGNNHLAYLGLGLFFTDFFPYFLHLNPSLRTSTSDFILNAILDVSSLLSPSTPVFLCFQGIPQIKQRPTWENILRMNSSGAMERRRNWTPYSPGIHSHVAAVDGDVAQVAILVIAAAAIYHRRNYWRLRTEGGRRELGLIKHDEVGEIKRWRRCVGVERCAVGGAATLASGGEVGHATGFGMKWNSDCRHDLREFTFLYIYSNV